jgi:uncharacterized membrane-anchored protein
MTNPISSQPYHVFLDQINNKPPVSSKHNTQNSKKEILAIGGSCLMLGLIIAGIVLLATDNEKDKIGRKGLIGLCLFLSGILPGVALFLYQQGCEDRHSDQSNMTPGLF